MMFLQIYLQIYLRAYLAFNLEHSKLVWGFLWHWLPQVPKFHDVTVLKAENVNDNCAAIARLLLHMGMDCYKFSFSDHTFHIHDLIGILQSVRLHSCLQGLRRPFEKRIVMPESLAHKLRVRLLNLPTGHHFEERDSGIFVTICHCVSPFLLKNQLCYPIELKI